MSEWTEITRQLLALWEGPIIAIVYATGHQGLKHKWAYSVYDAGVLLRIGCDPLWDQLHAMVAAEASLAEVAKGVVTP